MTGTEGVVHAGSIEIGTHRIEGRWEPGSVNVWLVVDDGRCGLRDLGYANLQDEGRLVLFPHFEDWVKDETTRTLVLSAARRWLDECRSKVRI